MNPLTVEQKVAKKFKGFKFGEDCQVHKHTSYVPLEDHHIWPKEWHGPDTKNNLVRVCSNGHGEIHYLLDLLLATGETNVVRALSRIDIVIKRRFGDGVTEYATRGFIRLMGAEVTTDGLQPWVG